MWSKCSHFQFYIINNQLLELVMTELENGEEELVYYTDDDAVINSTQEGIEEDVVTNEGLLNTASKKVVYTLVKYIFYLLLGAYVLAAFIIDFQRATSLFVIVMLVGAYYLLRLVARRNESSFNAAEDGVLNYLDRFDKEIKYKLITSSVLIGIVIVIVAIYVRNARNLISLFGLLIFVGLSWLISWKPKKVKLRPVLFGTFIQFMFGFVVIRTQWGLSAMEWLGEFFVEVLNCTYAGSLFVFGFLADRNLYGDAFVQVSGNYYVLAPPLFFNVLPTVIFFSALTSVGYYLHLIPWIIQTIGKWFINSTFFYFIARTASRDAIE